VEGSRQHKDFDEYLIPTEKFTTLKTAGKLPLSIATSCEEYLHERLSLLEQQLETVNTLAFANQLPDASITDEGMKITPLDAAVPEAAQQMIDQTAMMLPHVKITELFLDVDAWTGFTRHFTHLKNGETAKNKSLLLTAILADAINLGLSKIAESCPGTTYARLSWLQAWHIRDETYSKALAELVNAQSRHPFAEHWGDGTTSSSDGQRFKVGGKAESTGHINPKYGAEPGRTFYTHLSDQFAPYHAKAVTSASGMPPMCSMACFITSRICASRSITPIRPASPIMSSLSCIFWAFASRRGCAISVKRDSTCQSKARHTPP
jgi:hypothetical protein